MHSVALLPPDDCHCMQKSESSYWEPFWLPHSSQPSRHSSKSKIRNRKSRDPPTSTLMSGMTVIAPRCSKAPHGGGHDQGPATRREDPDERGIAQTHQPISASPGYVDASRTRWAGQPTGYGDTRRRRANRPHGSLPPAARTNGVHGGQTRGAGPSCDRMMRPRAGRGMTGCPRSGRSVRARTDAVRQVTSRSGPWPGRGVHR